MVLAAEGFGEVGCAKAAHFAPLQLMICVRVVFLVILCSILVLSSLPRFMVRKKLLAIERTLLKNPGLYSDAI